MRPLSATRTVAEAMAESSAGLPGVPPSLHTLPPRVPQVLDQQVDPSAVRRHLESVGVGRHATHVHRDGRVRRRAVGHDVRQRVRTPGGTCLKTPGTRRAGHVDRLRERAERGLRHDAGERRADVVGPVPRVDVPIVVRLVVRVERQRSCRRAAAGRAPGAAPCCWPRSTRSRRALVSSETVMVAGSAVNVPGTVHAALTSRRRVDRQRRHGDRREGRPAVREDRPARPATPPSRGSRPGIVIVTVCDSLGRREFARVRVVDDEVAPRGVERRRGRAAVSA